MSAGVYDLGFIKWKHSKEKHIHKDNVVVNDAIIDEFEDLLKLLDNDTASSVKSRFSNKVFNGKMIVITSSVPLSYWYRDYQYNMTDTLLQLYRRITSYVVVDEQYVNVYNEVDERGRPLGVPTVFKNEIPKLKREKPKKTDFASLFGDMLEDASPDLIHEMHRERGLYRELNK